MSTFKKAAPKAIKEIRQFAQKAMGTTGIRVDVKLNKFRGFNGLRRMQSIIYGGQLRVSCCYV